jgi:TRAP-type C4-dicarboxylate transport system permease small subunit
MGSLETVRLALVKISRWLTLLGGYALLTSAMLVCADVFVRKAFNLSLRGADELSGYALAMSTSFGCVYAFFHRSHIRIDFVYRLLSRRVRSVLDVASALSLAVLAALAAYFAMGEFWEALTFHALANTPLRTPLWIPQSIWAIGYVLFSLAIVVSVAESGLRLFLGEDARVSQLLGMPESAEM